MEIHRSRDGRWSIERHLDRYLIYDEDSEDPGEEVWSTSTIDQLYQCAWPYCARMTTNPSAERPRPTREECIERAARAFADGLALRDSLPPRQAAELAWTPTGPSIDELEAMIRADRGVGEAAAYDSPRASHRPALVLTIKELARVLKCSERTAKTLVANGTIPSVKIGAFRRIRLNDLTEFVDGLTLDRTLGAR